MGSKAQKLASKIIEDLLKNENEEEVERENTDLELKKGLKESTSASVSPSSRHRISKSDLAPVESLLGASQGLRLAQNKIFDLEKKLKTLKKENFDLLTTSQVFQNKADQLSEQMTSMKSQYEKTKEECQIEREALKASLSEKKKEVEESKTRMDTLEELISSKMQKIQSREQDLENRIEIMKKEADVLLRSKNKMILELKREIRSVSRVLDSYKVKGTELNSKLKNKEYTLKKSVKALHLALSFLEGS